MSFRSREIESALNVTDARCRSARLLHVSSRLGAVCCAVVLLIGTAVVNDWFTDRLSVQITLGLVLFATLLAWIGTATSILGARSDRRKLAARAEEGHASLFDRLNTLIFLERHRPEDGTSAFLDRIESQTRQVLRSEPVHPRIAWRRPILSVLTFAALLALVLYGNHRFHPWQHLQASQPPSAEVAQDANSDDLEKPDAHVTEEEKPWGEIRIVEPGRDLRISRNDTVALQIEAAASHALAEVAWYSTLNGQSEQKYPLPAPPEPRYAVYQPSIQPGELGLEDWDVLTYYAKARTARDDAHASEIYFIEVRPTQEELASLPGGASGKAYQFLGELTELIQRQQQVIRETHRHVRQPARDPKVQAEERQRLAESEGALTQSTLHLGARISDLLQNSAPDALLSHLSQAASELKTASGQLKASEAAAAQTTERTALAELIASRKFFQQCIGTHAEAFAEDAGENDDRSEEKLKAITEFRDAAKAAGKFVEDLVTRQKDLARRAASQPRITQTKLADDQKAISTALQEFQEQHPELFEPAATEAAAAREAMEASEKALRSKSSRAAAATQSATDKLEALGSKIDRSSLEQQLAQAYTLKRLLDQKIQQLGELEKNPAKLTPGEQEKLAGQCLDIASGLKRMADESPTREAFDEPLRNALSDERQQALERDLASLKQAANAEDIRESAAQSRSHLQQISDAFQQSQPGANEQFAGSNPLQPGPAECMQLGLLQLQNLLRQAQTGSDSARSGQQEAKQEAMSNLLRGLSGLYGNNQESRELLLLIEQELKEEARPLDFAHLKKLMDALENFSLEVKDQAPQSDPVSSITHIDPARLPAAYRSRIEKYFEKLSEK